MKWSRSIPAVALEEAPYLCLRYRAEGLRTDSDDYLVYVDDGVAEAECRPVRLRDAVADGQWRSVVVDLRDVARGPSVGAVAVQVQAGPGGQAKLWIDAIGIEATPPAEAEWLQSQAQAPPEYAFDLSEASWASQPAWLGNPARRFASDGDDGTTRFRVNEPGRGMKWHWAFAEAAPLAGHRFVTMRYRAENLSRYHDYALCFLGETADGSLYEEVVRGRDLQADGRWRTLSAPLDQAAQQVPEALGMAVQAQASEGPGTLELAEVRLVSDAPRVGFAESVPFEPSGDFEGFHAADLSACCNQTTGPVLDVLHVGAWPTDAELTAFGVPFRLRPGETALAATGIRAKTDLAIPVGVRTGEIYLLAAAVLRGQEEDVYGGGPFQRIAGVDRFRLRLDYDDGTTEECLPGNVSSGRFEVVKGPQVLCASADPDRTLTALTLHDRTAQGGFAVAALTCRTAKTPLFPQFDESVPVARPRPEPRRRGVASLPGGEPLVIESDSMRVQVARAQGCSMSIFDKVAGREVVPWICSWLSFDVEGPRPVLGYYPIVERARVEDDGTLTLDYRVSSCPDVQLRAQFAMNDTGALVIRGELVNRGEKPHSIGVTFPQIGPYVLGDDPASNAYVYPCRAAYVGREPVNLETRYGGLFGVQFMATFDPAAGQGLYLRTEDTTCIERSYILRKNREGMLLAVRYPERPLEPGETRPLADTVIALTDGGWHEALLDYRRWLRTWHQPAAPRKAWFREVFNFRQRFLHWLDPLYDPATGVIDLPRAIHEAREHFGGVEYLHLFDWGNCGPHGRIYGRVGDYSPYDFLQGRRDNLHGAIAGVRDSGVPVGLYIEGYLLDERGKLGRAHGANWQLMRADGAGARWPNSAEIYVCPGVEAWRAVQAETYAAKVRELDVDGMYIDQFGFTGTYKDCHSPDHGHAVPSYPVLTELATTKAIRRAVDAAKPGVAIYTEESPCDVTSQYQDGAFTYEMNQCHARGARIPINLFRFAVPDFKTFEILICDKPTASWATGVRWTFFNGEGLWLEGTAQEWFAPETLAEIRKCHAILREHRDAFTSLEPLPLVATPASNVWANYFPAAGKEVWTLYNARHRTFRGPLLRAPHRDGWVWRDAWHGRPATVDRRGPEDVVETELGPMGVGCLVRTEAG